MDASLVFGVCLQSRRRQHGICCCFPEFSCVSVTWLAPRCGVDCENNVKCFAPGALYKLKSVFFLFIVLLLEKHNAATQIEISSFLFIVLLLGNHIPFKFYLTRLPILVLLPHKVTRESTSRK